MPEAPAWKFEKIIKPMFDTPKSAVLLRGRVVSGTDSPTLEDGIVELENGSIKAVPQQHFVSVFHLFTHLDKGFGYTIKVLHIK